MLNTLVCIVGDRPISPMPWTASSNTPHPGVAKVRIQQYKDLLLAAVEQVFSRLFNALSARYSTNTMPMDRANACERSTAT